MEPIEQDIIRKVVLDAGPVIHLDEINCLNLLTDFKELLISEVVWNEVKYHRPSILPEHQISFIQIPASKNININMQVLCNTFNLDEGERQALSLCLIYPNSILLTDDAAARLAAKSIGMRVYGTIGVLLRAVRRKQLSPEEVIKHLHEIPSRSTLFIKTSLIEEVIKEVKKEYGL